MTQTNTQTDDMKPDEHASLRDDLVACLAVHTWVDRVLAQAPFKSAGDLEEAARTAFPLSTAEVEAAMADHPAIGHRHSNQGQSADFSNAEQAAIRVGDPSQATSIQARIDELGARYEQRFGHVFLIRAAGRTQAQVLAELERRLPSSAEEEARTTEQELEAITLLRVAKIAARFDRQAPSSQLSTHVLDTRLGQPASGIAVTLVSAEGTPLAHAQTNADGRAKLGAAKLTEGEYALIFDTLDYQRAAGVRTFYPRVTVWFTVSDDSPLHVPVLLSPYGYTTYRGS